MTSTQNMWQLVRDGNLSIPRKSIAESQEFKDVTKVPEEDLKALADALGDAVPYLPRIPEYGDIKHWVQASLSEAVSKEKTVKQALDDLQAAALSIMKTGGYYD
jgi:ABC-type glycerol-3-phosphate transport system substrate-binding protein